MTAAHFTASRFMEAAQSTLEQPGGFSINHVTLPRQDMLCGPSGTAVQTRQLSGPSHALVVTVVSGAQAGAMCAALTMMNAAPTPPPPAPLPTLTAPPGVTISAEKNTETAFQDAFGNRNAQLSGVTNVASTGQSFAAQFEKAGWAADAPAQSATVYAQLFHVVTKGVHYQALLTLVATDKAQAYDASIAVKNLDAKNNSIFGFSF